MLKLLRNYIREQKQNLLQIFGLGFLVIIMIVTFLTLNFSNSYVYNQYMNDITHNEFNQSTYFSTPENTSFFGKYNETRNNVGLFLDNINYYQKDETKDNGIDKDKMKNATFQLKWLNPHELDPVNNRYEFIFHGGSTNSDEYFGIGNNLFVATKHEHIDFKINIPKNYPTVATYRDKVKEYASILEKYVYDGISTINRTNFMITSSSALQFYNDNFHKIGSPNYLLYANRVYDESDISNEAKLYEIMMMGMLYKNIEWDHETSINDLLITSKNFAFIETGTDYFVNKPIIVKNGGRNLKEKPLQDDEILVYQQFAKLNHLQIGQSYVIAGKSFIIRGYATSAISTYVGRYFSGAVDLKNNTIAFTNANTFNKVETSMKEFKGNLYVSYFLGSNPDKGTLNIDASINNVWIYDYLHNRYNNVTKYNFDTSGDHSKNGIDYYNLISPLNIPILSNVSDVQNWTFGTFLNRVSVIEQISSVFLGLIFVVTIIIIFIITFKMIDRKKKLIGVLKATGYTSWQLSITLVVSIVIPLLLFAIVGVLISIPLAHYLIIVSNVNIMALISYGWYFNFSTAILLIVIPVVVLVIISFLLVLFLLRIKPLDLINNNVVKQKYKLNVSAVFIFIARYVTKNYSYHNKLAITTSMRSFGKTLIMGFTSVFAATLVFFALAASGLVNDMLGSQFAGTNFNYQNGYQFDEKIKDNFIGSDNKLMYQFNDIDNIKTQPSLYPELMQAVKDFASAPTKPIIINIYNRYIMGSELLKIRVEIEKDLNRFGTQFKTWWEENKILIDYVTNDNGRNSNDLMLSFGLIPFDKKNEVPYTQLNFNYANDLDLTNQNQVNCHFDNDTQTLSNSCVSTWAAPRKAYGISDNLTNFLSPTFSLSSFSSFSNLNLKDMALSSNWQDKQFISIRNELINKLDIINPDSSSVQFIPMASSTLPTVKRVYDGGEAIGKSIIYSYQGLDHQKKYIIGIAYDTFNKLDPSIILMPQIWLNNAIFGHENNSLINNFANTKLSKFNDNEFKHYLPIISNKNDYNIDLTKIATADYLESKGIKTSLVSVYDISNLRSIMKITQYSLQTVITFFGLFSIILAFMIITIVSNITVRDNLILINILRSLGYTSIEVSYNFFFVMIPILVISSLAAVFVVPTLVGVLAGMLTNFAKIVFPVVFRWWYFALMIAINVIIYLISYIITWKLNVNNKQLMTLTK